MVKRTIRGIATMVLASAVLGVACTDEQCTLTAPLCDIRTVAVEPGSVVLTRLNDSIQLTVVARNGQDSVLSIGAVPFTWVSSAPTIVSVSSNGMVRSLMAGEATITVSSTALEDSVRNANVTVDLSALPSALGVVVQPPGANLGATMPQAPVVHIRNDRGQLVTSTASVTASLASGPGTLGGTLTVPAVAGVATFTNLQITGSAGTHTIRFTSPGLGAATSLPFLIADAALPPGIVHFTSDWRTALGTSDAAMRDGGRWPQWNWGFDCPTNPSNCSVKIIDDTDFPSGRAFWSGYHGNRSSTGGSMTGSGTLIIDASDNKWPQPNVGQTIFHRFYLKNSVDSPRIGRNLSRGGHHPVEGWGDDPVLGQNCAFHWEHKFDARTDGTFNWEIANLRNQGSWVKSGLQLQRVYMIEVAFTRTGTSRFRVRARLDGVDQGQIFPADAEIGAFCLRSFFMGNNDPWSGATDPERWRNLDGSPLPTGPFGDLDALKYGAVAIAVRNDANDWIGPYVLSRGW